MGEKLLVELELTNARSAECSFTRTNAMAHTAAAQPKVKVCDRRQKWRPGCVFRNLARPKRTPDEEKCGVKTSPATAEFLAK